MGWRPGAGANSLAIPLGLASALRTRRPARFRPFLFTLAYAGNQQEVRRLA